MLNKVIWTYWYQGLDNAPPIIKPCVERWKKLNPEWELRLLHKKNLDEYIGEIEISVKKIKDMSLAVSSDLIKLQILIKHGGVWVDATTYPLLPLDDWIHDKMQAGYFYFFMPGRDRIISTWFIAANKNNKMLIAQYKALVNYWTKNDFRNIGVKRSPLVNCLNRIINRNLFLTRLWFTPLFTKLFKLTTYTITHFMFYNILCKHKDLRLTFKKMPKIKPDLAHALKLTIANRPLSPEIKEIIDQKKIPILKLNRKMRLNSSKVQISLNYLFSLN